MEINNLLGFGWGGLGSGLFGLMWSNHVVTGLRVYAGWEGPQIVLTWTLPAGFIDRLRIYRKTGEYPKNPADPEAVLVYDTGAGLGVVTVTSFADTTENPLKVGAAPEAGTWYYYSVYTESAKDGVPPVTADSARGFDLAYSLDDFESDTWRDLFPDSWHGADTGTSQRRLVGAVDTATNERFVFTDTPEPRGFAERFWGILARLHRRLFVHTDEIWQTYDFARVRADAMRHLSYMLGAPLYSRDSFRVWRSRLQDAPYLHRTKGSFDCIDAITKQDVAQGDYTRLVEMHTRVLYAWNPQDPNTVNGSWVVDDTPNQEESDDISTYCWSAALESPYNERGLRLYWDDFLLTPYERWRLTEELRGAKPFTVTFEVWEQGWRTVLVT